MNEYYVFEKENKSTYPLENKYILLWLKDCDYPVVCKFVGDDVIDANGNFYSKLSIDRSIYCYVGKRPEIKKELNPKKCGMDLGYCEFYDDGYCTKSSECGWCVSQREYVIE